MEPTSESPAFRQMLASSVDWFLEPWVPLPLVCPCASSTGDLLSLSVTRLLHPVHNNDQIKMVKIGSVIGGPCVFGVLYHVVTKVARVIYIVLLFIASNERRED